MQQELLRHFEQATPLFEAALGTTVVATSEYNLSNPSDSEDWSDRYLMAGATTHFGLSIGLSNRESRRLTGDHTGH